MSTPGKQTQYKHDSSGECVLRTGLWVGDLLLISSKKVSQSKADFKEAQYKLAQKVKNILKGGQNMLPLTDDQANSQRNR